MVPTTAKARMAPKLSTNICVSSEKPASKIIGGNNTKKKKLPLKLSSASSSVSCSARTTRPTRKPSAMAAPLSGKCRKRCVLMR